MRAGDSVRIDFGVPLGSEPGFVRPAIVVTADLVLAMHPRTVHVVPLTGNVSRQMPAEVPLDVPELPKSSVAQVHLCTVVSVQRIIEDAGVANVGPASPRSG